MTRCRCVVGLLLAALLAGVLGSPALGDELVLRDGRVVEGTLEALTSEYVKFRTGPRTVLNYPLVLIAEVNFSPRPGRETPLTFTEWTTAMAAARRKLDHCRLSRNALIGGGLLFVAGGQYLSALGDRPLGGLLTGLGAVLTLFGVASPPPQCGPERDRVEVLTRIGLEFGWVY